MWALRRSSLEIIHNLASVSYIIFGPSIILIVGEYVYMFPSLPVASLSFLDAKYDSKFWTGAKCQFQIKVLFIFPFKISIKFCNNIPIVFYSKVLLALSENRKESTLRYSLLSR